MPRILQNRPPTAELGVLEMVRTRGGPDSSLAAAIVRGRVDAGGKFRMTFPWADGVFLGVVIRELSAMGTATLAVLALWEDGLILPVFAPVVMSGTPNEAFAAAQDGLSSVAFGPEAVNLAACPIRIDVTGATAGGRFVLMVGFR